MFVQGWKSSLGRRDFPQRTQNEFSVQILTVFQRLCGD